ncbi:MAG: ATP-binding protein [Myxococcaceae bacterium]
MTRIWASIDSLAGAEPNMPDHSRWRGRYITIVTGLGIAASLAIALAYVVIGSVPDAISAVIGAGFCGGLLAVWRKWKRAALIANIFGALITVVYFAGFAVRRELAMVAWLAVAPTLVLFMGGRRSAVAWLLIELGLMFAAATMGIPNHPEQTASTAVMRLVALMVVLFGLSLLFDLAADSALERLRVATEIKTRFLANVSHELRTPLNGVIGMAELMAQHELSGSQRERLDTILQTGQQLRLLIDDVLDLTQLERAALRVTEAPVMARDVAAAAIKQLQSSADVKRLSVALEAPGERLALRTDALRLMQVISNLVSNAIKFTQRGGVTVVVQTTPHGAEQVKLVIEVRDTGPGLSSDELKQLFKPFSRLARDANVKGTGLGLSIVKLLVELLGGTVSASSTVGVGSTFRVELVRPRAAMSLELPAVVPATQALHVLLVDDNAINLKVARGLLEKLGCGVTTASDGRQAVELFRPGVFDLVLMDLHMPVMDGFAAARAIRAKDAVVKMLALSATTVREEIDGIEAAGMNGFLAKPVRLEQLRAVLPAASEQRQTA